MNRVVVICCATASVAREDVHNVVETVRAESPNDDITLIDLYEDADDSLCSLDRLRYIDAAIVLIGPLAGDRPAIERPEPQRLLERYARNAIGLLLLRLPGAPAQDHCVLGRVLGGTHDDGRSRPFASDAPYRRSSTLARASVRSLLQRTRLHEPTADDAFLKNRQAVIGAPEGLRRFYEAFTGIGWTAPRLRPWIDSADFEWLDRDPRGTALTMLEDSVAWAIVAPPQHLPQVRVLGQALLQIARPPTFGIDDLQTPVMVRAAAGALSRAQTTDIADGLVRLEHWARAPQGPAPVVFAVGAELAANLGPDVMRAQMRGCYDALRVVDPPSAPQPIDDILPPIAAPEEPDDKARLTPRGLADWHAEIDEQQAWYKRPTTLPIFFVDGRALSLPESAQQAHALQTASPRAVGVLTVHEHEMTDLLHASRTLGFTIVRLADKALREQLATARDAFNGFRSKYEKTWTAARQH